MASSNIIELRNLGKVYDLGAVQVPALRGRDFEIKEGSYTAIMGPSGSGKSTLLTILGCLDRPTSGAYLLGGDDVAGMSDKELSRIRGTRIGFIFQSYNLIEQLNVVENVHLPLFYQGDNLLYYHLFLVSAQIPQLGLDDQMTLGKDKIYHLNHSEKIIQ